tara:strand:- start:24 stop:983 length:960 start_codon:yes stop_codon:yes gene_type:complete
MTEEGLRDYLAEYTKKVEEYSEPIENYKKVYNDLEKNFGEFVTLRSKLFNLTLKLNVSTFTKKVDNTFLGFKTGETEYKKKHIHAPVGVHGEFSDLSKKYDQCIDRISLNPLMVDSSPPSYYKGNDTISSYILGLEDEHYIPLSKFTELNSALEKKHFLNVEEDEIESGKEILFTLNRTLDRSRVLTKAGAKIVFEKKLETPLRRKRQIELELRSRKRSKKLSTDLNHIYIFSNKSYSNNTFKIGWTSDDPEIRAEQLSADTGVLYPFKVEYSKRFKDAEKVEKKIHKHFNEFRIRKNKEYFEVEKEKIITYIEKLSAK